MESELERFHKQNTSLELNITELRLKLKATDKEMHLERQRVSISPDFFVPDLLVKRSVYRQSLLCKLVLAKTS